MNNNQETTTERKTWELIHKRLTAANLNYEITYIDGEGACEGIVTLEVKGFNAYIKAIAEIRKNKLFTLVSERSM
jgi:hypothetical protein